MYRNPAHAAPRTPTLVRSGVTASAVALAIAGLAAPAAAQTPGEDVAPPAPADDGPSTETAPAQAEPQAEVVLYEVAAGDHLAAIAVRHGLDPSDGWRVLLGANPEITDPDVITPGQVLRIPVPAPSPEPAAPPATPEQADPSTAEGAPEPVLYEVVAGDDLASIAVGHGLDAVGGWKLLFDANPDVADPDLITPGQVLRIPDPAEDLEARALPAPPPPATNQTASTPAPQQSSGQSGPAPATRPQVNTSAPAGVWDRLAQCESGGNWHINTGNGYYGGLQFSPSSWRAVGGSGLPHEASRGEQIARGQQLQAIQGWGAWPSCSRQLGLR